LIPIVTASQMQAIDKCAIDRFGIPGLMLMENAGRGVFHALRHRFPDLQGKRVVIFCGKGNNGGDGFVGARYLKNHDAEVQVLLIGKMSDLKNDARTNAEIADNLGVPIHEIDENNFNSQSHSIRHADILVDAIFGTGLSKPAAGFHERVIEEINDANKFVLAVDIPSGLDSDTGFIMGPHVRAGLTVTFGLMKRSHLLHPATTFMGQVETVDIGLPPPAVAEMDIPLHSVEPSDIAAWLGKRPSDAHKGSFGHVLVVAGSLGKGGAAGLTAVAALRAGCGLVTLALPASCQRAVEFYPLEVMTVPLPETAEGRISTQALGLLQKHAEGKSALAVGPGISTDPETVELLGEFLPALPCPRVVDADAINSLAQGGIDLTSFLGETIITPHPREMSRISGQSMEEIQQNRIDAAASFAVDKNVTVVLKGAASIIAFADGSTFINPTGNSGMATAGSGDVLTGIIAGFIAQGLGLKEATLAGVYCHGAAGDRAAEAIGERSLLASDLMNALPETLKTLAS